jgi:copper chaperone CopZ
MIPSGGMEVTYTVPGIHCAHCEAAIRQEVGGVAGVDEVTVDLERKLVTVTGRGFEDALVRDAIDEAGYDIA